MCTASLKQLKVKRTQINKIVLGYLKVHWMFEPGNPSADRKVTIPN